MDDAGRENDERATDLFVFELLQTLFVVFGLLSAHFNVHAFDRGKSDGSKDGQA